jgi:vacuolar-type H+-ATPase subunit I/STV1
VKDRIEITQNFRKYIDLLNKATKKIDNAESIMEKIDNELEETEKWSGDAHDQCLYAFSLIQEYTLKIKDLVVELGICLDNVYFDMEGFESVSRNVNRWRSW